MLLQEVVRDLSLKYTDANIHDMLLFVNILDRFLDTITKEELIQETNDTHLLEVVRLRECFGPEKMVSFINDCFTLL